MTKKPLSGFELDFEVQRLKLGMTKTQIASDMGITMPTLSEKIKNKEKLTIKEIRKLQSIGFEIKF